MNKMIFSDCFALFKKLSKTVDTIGGFAGKLPIAR